MKIQDDPDDTSCARGMSMKILRQMVYLFALMGWMAAPLQGQPSSPGADSPGSLGKAMESRMAFFHSTEDPIATNKRLIRVLVSYNDTNYFVVDGGKQRGLEYDLMRTFEKYLNGGKVPTDKGLHLVFISVPFDQLLPKLVAGEGDVAAAGFTITPEREKLVAFSRPYRKNVTEILVRHSATKPLASLQDLAGKRMHLVSGSSYLSHTHRLNQRFAREGLKPVLVEEVDPNLEAEDVLQMVNANIYRYTLVDDHIAMLWSQVLDNIVIQPDISVNQGGEIAWAVRKNNPALLARLNKFVAGHKQGTLLGNMLFKRYYKNTRWVRNPVNKQSKSTIAKLRPYFRKYGEMYHIDWKLLAALAFQESGLDQKKKNRSGAVGVMQIKPSTAADKNIGIKGVAKSAEKNIHAGAKYLAFLRKRYFSDPAISKEAQIDFTLAAYNAGPARVQSLRKKAAKKGLDRNQWFFNVEHVARKQIGKETVTYVANILKYYIAFESAEETLEKRGRAGAGVKGSTM
jgi:membrane-bound lytic murein transglycosylase MltF